MGKTGGYLESKRQEPGKEAVAERLRHYREIYRYLTGEEIRKQASRCMKCGTPFCHGAGCPLGNLTPEWNDLVFRGRWREAADLLHMTSNFPEITGRVCPALCEAACVLAIHGEAVTVRQIELAVVEKAWQEGWITPRPPQVETGKSVAIVGSGPAGLAAAQQLRRAGHHVTVFEKADRLGGLLRYGIPDFKLAKDVLDRRLCQLREEGIECETGVDAGRDISAAYLRRKYDAICICIGAGVPRDMKIPGREAKGIYQAIDYLTQQNRRVAGLAVPAAEEIVAAGKRVIIIGGGDTSNDCLGTALRQGAASVQQFEILPQPPSGENPLTPWPMWPLILRVSSSHEEGGERRWCVNTRAFLVADGRVVGLECEEVRWTRDEKTGQMRFTPVPDSVFRVEADLVLLAMGFLYPQRDGLLTDLEVECDARGNIKTDPNTMMTNVRGVFAAGDAQTGAWLVVGAMAGGRRMARQVDLFLMGESDLPDCQPPPRLYI